MPDGDLTPGWATPAGTRRYAARFAETLPGHFRRPDDLSVASIALGTRRGDIGGSDDLAYRTALLELLEGGVNVVSTAIFDRMQSSERALGAALARAFAQGLAQRDEVVVITKGGYLALDPDLAHGPGGARRYLVETYLRSGLVDPARVVNGRFALDPPFLRDQIERSRRNLRLATLDAFLIQEPELHLLALGPDAFRALLREVFEALERAVADRLIRAYGICSWDGLLLPPTERGHLSVLELFELALDVAGGGHHLRVVQLPFGLGMGAAGALPSQPGPTRGPAALLDALRDTGTLVLASAPLLGGRALGRLPPLVREAFPGLSDAQRCLQFARSAPGVCAAVVGMRSDSHVRENLALLRVPPVAPEVIEGIFKAAAPASEEAPD